MAPRQDPATSIVFAVLLGVLLGLWGSLIIVALL
jgi:hypothetical protein